MRRSELRNKCFTIKQSVMILPSTGFTIGADPEMFIINEKTGDVVSSIGIIPGEKGDPWVDPTWPDGFGLEIDNILVEYNIPPALSKEQFISAIEFMKSYIKAFVKNVNPDYDILCTSSRMVNESELNNPIAQLFGCCPDFNCYTGSPNPRPKGEKTNLRSAGFHVHYGYLNPSIDQSVEMVKYFDIFLGLMSLFFDNDRKRRSLYGKAGCYRLTSYGVEYRTLSSKMAETTEMLSLIYDGVLAATQAYEERLPMLNSDDVVNAINSSDVNAARYLLNIMRSSIRNDFFAYAYLNKVLNIK